MKHAKPVTVCKGQTYFVHRYKHRHDKRRRKSRRLLKKGCVAVVGQNATGWYYMAMREITLT